MLRLLGSDEFGSLNLIIFLTYSVKEIIYFRIWESINKFLSSFKAEGSIEKIRAYIKLSVIIEIVTALAGIIIIIASGGFIVDTFYEGKINIYYLYLYSLILLADSPYEIFNAVLRIENKYEVLITSNFVFPIIKLVIIIALILVSNSIFYAIIGLIASSIILNLYMIVGAYKKVNYLKGFSKTSLSVLKENKRSIISFLTSTNFTGLIKVGQKRFDVLIAGYFLNLNDVAYYRMIKYLSDFIAFPLNPIYYNSFVLFNKLKANNKFKLFKKVFVSYSRNAFIYGAFIFTIILLFNEVILDLYMQNYASAIRTTFIFYSAGVCLATISNFNYPLFTSTNKNWVAAVLTSCALIIQYSVILIYMPQIGIKAAGYAYFASYLFWYVFSNYYIISRRKVIFA